MSAEIIKNNKKPGLLFGRVQVRGYDKKCNE
jgi:hypothetical protein